MMRSYNPLATLLPLAALLLAAPAAARKPADADPALWRIADADTTIYLFGTIHLLPQGVEWFNGPLAQAFEGAQELVTEIPEVDNATRQNALVTYAVLPPGRSLRAMFTPAEEVKYLAALKALGQPPATFDRYKPWYAAVVLTTLALQKNGYDISHGAEAALDERNTALRRPRTGLETFEMQLSLFDSFPEDVQKRYLLDVLAALPKVNGEVAKLLKAWTSGDARRLAELLNADQDDPAMVDRLLYQRNKAWAQWIKARLDRPGTVFVAVGAGHLGGKQSVQDELAAAGIKVTRVQ